MRTIDASLATWMGAHSRVPGLLAATGAQAKGLPASSPTPPPAGTTYQSATERADVARFALDLSALLSIDGLLNKGPFLLFAR
jgi:hypothetical protein